MPRDSASAHPSFRETFPCPYFSDGRTASLEYATAAEGQAKIFHEFLAAGYRRFGNVFYQNVCEDCSSCKPIRVAVEGFRPSRSQKRTLRKNSDVRVEIVRSLITPEKISLYTRYLRSKHAEKGQRETREIAFNLAHLHYGYPGTIEMDYYLGESLIGVGIVDESADALSANYFYYDTDCLDRRPGVFSILHEIFLAGRMGKKYHYLGFYIGETEKMSYKKFFRPAQILEDGTWRQFLPSLNDR